LALNTRRMAAFGLRAKNESRSPVEIDIPIHSDLARVIDATRSGHLTFLVTAYGRPFSTAGFGLRFREWCDEVGLHHCSSRGLRKAAAARLAESGATPHEIMAITGHRTLSEVERYTRAANKPGLADSAMAKLEG
jgi:integrase/recombinase XerD